MRSGRSVDHPAIIGAVLTYPAQQNDSGAILGAGKAI